MAVIRIVLSFLMLAGSSAPADKAESALLGLDAYMAVPEDNPLTPGKVKLGRSLFFDPRLSRDGTLACAGCHKPEHAFTDGRATAVGIAGRKGARRTPTLVNRGYGRAFFWDGRAGSLEEQVLQPIVNPSEMDLTIEEAIARVNSSGEYRDAFRNVFGRDVNRTDLARALASYVRTIRSGSSSYDRYVAGDRDALPEEARQGLRLFQGKANCTACHMGPNLTDEMLHNTGVAWKQDRLADGGRAAVTKDEQDRGAFKTPTLREVSRTAPYMHDGSLATLEEVVEYYDRGGNRNPHPDPEIRPLKLTPEEKRALVLFLKSLNGELREGE